MDDCIAALSGCHSSMEAQLEMLEALARGAEPAAADARAVMRYFDTEGLQHHRDEDEDLFPLLRTLAAERDRADIASVINELEREHSTMERQWSRLREQLLGGGVDADDVMRFAWLCRRHMQYEAAALLPFAAEVLSAEQRAVLAGRMAARRGVPA